MGASLCGGCFELLGGVDRPQRCRSSSSRSSAGVERAAAESHPSNLSPEQHALALRRLRNLEALDDATKIPLVLVELHGHCLQHGYVEISGKDEYGVYGALDKWLTTAWGCERLGASDLRDHETVPLCGALYWWPGFVLRDDGLNNIGWATMELVKWMCGQLGWTLGVVASGSLGNFGQIREQQVIFKAPHPMNMVVPHLLLELRSGGDVQLSSGDAEALDRVGEHLHRELGAEELAPGEGRLCDRSYHFKVHPFKRRGGAGENNLGLLTTRMCDKVTSLLPGWSLAAMGGWHRGEDGAEREQQLVFRRDRHPSCSKPHLLVELREAGYVEVNGQDVKGIHSKLEHWLVHHWKCQPTTILEPAEGFYDHKFSWHCEDMLAASAELTAFFCHNGWEIQQSSQRAVSTYLGKERRERQLVFRPGASEEGVAEPHLFVEIFAGEGEDGLYEMRDVTQVLREQYIRVCEVGSCGGAGLKFGRFLCDYLGGKPINDTGNVKRFSCDILLCRGAEANNIGYWTMRLCDFMVDRLGWSFVVCDTCNLGRAGRCREQLLIFRYDGERAEIPTARRVSAVMPRPGALFDRVGFPQYWRTPRERLVQVKVEILSCTTEEVKALQHLFDTAFRKDHLRDGEANRLEVVHAFRAEHAELYRRFAERREDYKGNAHVRLKTHEAAPLLNGRLEAGEALLAHGTNPSSAMGILKAGFKLQNAGKSTATIFGPGIYLAEFVSKSDQYATSDSGNNFPGLRAMLICRCLVGKPHVVSALGDHVAAARARGLDCVIGDRPSGRELVFFDERQVLPEYAVIYRHDSTAPSLRASLAHSLAKLSRLPKRLRTR